jgi:hypothetical protein
MSGLLRPDLGITQAESGDGLRPVGASKNAPDQPEFRRPALLISRVTGDHLGP